VRLHDATPTIEQALVGVPRPRGGCRLRPMFRSVSAAAMLFSVLLLAGCGESAQEKAEAQVCSARADISKQIGTLSALTVSTTSVTTAKTSFEAISSDLTKIRDAQKNLAPARKQQLEAATQTFETQLTSIVNEFTSTLSLSNAATQAKSAVTKLTSSYRQTLAPISCS
jgi:Tfp pilus assembly protein PilP